MPRTQKAARLAQAATAIAAALLAGLAFTPAAQATCLYECTATVVDQACEAPDGGEWPADVSLTFTASCQTCCSAPGGPLDCDASAFLPADAVLVAGEVTLDLEATATGDSCGGTPVYAFPAPLEPGPHQLISVAGGFNLILFQIEVVAASGGLACASDADCAPCDACVAGQCLATPGAPPACASDADCAGDQVCAIVAGAPCLNACVDAVEPECATDADCAPCDACVAGQCLATPGAPPECDSDADCGEGLICSIVPGAPCLNACVDGVEPECAEDADCGACSVCIDGMCFGTGLVACESNADCAEGQVCEVDASNPCANQCVDGDPVEPGACATDADCGTCGACVYGQCAREGDVPCEADGDCSDAETCVVDPMMPCLNQCVPVDEPDCGSSDDCDACDVCTEGVCVPAPAVAECSNDADCAEGLACVASDDACAMVCAELEPTDGPDAGGTDGGGMVEPGSQTDGGDEGCAGQGGSPLGALAGLLGSIALLTRRRRALA